MGKGYFIAIVLTVLLSSLNLMSSKDLPADFSDSVLLESLIVNGGFEKDFLGWNKGGCATCSTINPLIVHDGKKSYGVDTTAANMGSFIWQSIPEGIQDFRLRVFVYREQSNAKFELVRNWEPSTGRADFVTEVNFAHPSSGTLALRAWNVLLITDFIWPSDGWHELAVVAHWSQAKQEFFVDDRLVGTIQACTVFSPERLILGDVKGLGWQARYFFDGLSLSLSKPSLVMFYMPFMINKRAGD